MNRSTTPSRGEGDVDPTGFRWPSEQEWKALGEDETLAVLRCQRQHVAALATTPSPDASPEDCDNRIRAWRDQFEGMHQRAMKAEAQLRALSPSPDASPDSGIYPTEQMLAAGLRECRVSTHADKGVVLDVWNAMWAARPSPSPAIVKEAGK